MACEVSGCKEKKTPHAIKVMKEKRFYCDKHFKEIFKELKAIPDTPEKEDEED